MDRDQMTHIITPTVEIINRVKEDKGTDWAGAVKVTKGAVNALSLWIPEGSIPSLPTRLCDGDLFHGGAKTAY